MLKTSITISEDIYEEAKKISNNFSFIVTNALKEYMKKQQVNKAKSSFGKWQEREKNSVKIVSEIRKDRNEKIVN